jgi:hypothetical protein
MADILVANKDDRAAIRRFQNMLDGTFAERVVAVLAPGYPAGSTPLQSSSGNVANAAAVAPLAAAAGKTNFLCGFEVTGGGATAAAIVQVTVTGLLSGTATYLVGVVAGATAPNAPLMVKFNPPLQAATTNTAIVVTVPALGAGNTNSAVVAHGYQA